jgi:hypothetical protein
MINIKVYRLSDNKFLEDFSVGNYIGNHNEINKQVKRISNEYNCEVYFN